MERSDNHKVAIIWAIGCIFAVLAAHLFDYKQSSQLAQELLNSLHAPGFGIIAFVTMVILRRKLRSHVAYLLAAGIAFSLGIVSEFLQVYGPRDADLADLGRNALGIVGFLAFAAALDPPITRNLEIVRRITFVLLTSPILIAAVAPPIWYSYSIVQRTRAIPWLLRFDAAWESEIYRTPSADPPVVLPVPDNWPAKSGNLARISLDQSLQPALIIEPHADWSGFDAFSFIAASTDTKEHEITVRINDIFHNNSFSDRFNRRVSVSQQPQLFRFSLDEIRESPRHRQMDLTAIEGIIIFKRNAADGDAIFVDDFRLERD